ncbi:MAG TPA: flavin monoamine oxidase family protein [Thermoleophilaceae bacterium]
MAEPRSHEADLVVVGAGLAGMTAAREAVASGASVVVVEARDRVGGRVLNHDIGGGAVVELGGQWIGPTQDRLAALAGELGVGTFPTHDEGENVIDYAGSLRRYTGTIPRINPLVLLDVQRAQHKLNRLARRVPLEAPWRASDAARLDAQTAATWMRRNLVTRAGRALLELGIEAVWAAEPEEMSLLHVLFYIRSAGSLEILFDTAGGAQQDRFVGGSQLVPLRLAERLGGERLVLGAPVRRIEHGPDGVAIHADGTLARGRRAIVALAPTLAGRIAYDPPLPGYRDQLTQRMPLGTVGKCMAIYDEPFWRAEGLSGQATSDTGPVKLTYDNSPPGGAPGVLLGFLEGRHARELGRLPADKRRSAVLDCFVRLFGPRAGRPDAYVERLWADEEWSRGCYGCHMPTGAWTSYGPALREPIGPLHWAGAECATVWNGYMDGAVRSGEQAAREALERI